jgi:putative FmdB family regulatory protein
MPLYTYECKQCEYKFDSFHSMNESLKLCEKCGKETLERIPQLLTSYSKQKSERDMAGERVEKFIEDSRKLLLDSKQELKGREYK